jgi:hypothetical protein
MTDDPRIMGTAAVGGAALPPLPPPTAHLADLARVASHECGHGLLALLYAIPFDVISIRPGAGFRGVTLLGPSAGSREAREHRIMAVLAGDLAASIPPLVGRPLVGRSERVAAVAVADLHVDVREALFAAEEDADVTSDAQAAMRASRILNDGDASLVPEHLAYLSARAGAALGIHRIQLQHLAAALLRRSVLSYPTAAAIFGSTRRCACHGYVAPTEEVIASFRSIGCIDHTAQGVPI